MGITQFLMINLPTSYFQHFGECLLCIYLYISEGRSSKLSVLQMSSSHYDVFCRYTQMYLPVAKMTPSKKKGLVAILLQKASFYTLPRRRQWHPTPVLLPRKSHGQRSLVGCSPWGEKSWTRLSDFTFTFHFHAEGNGNPLQCPCLENPRDRGAWLAAVYGVAQSWTRVKQLSSIPYLEMELFTLHPCHRALSVLSLCITVDQYNSDFCRSLHSSARL